MRIRPISAELSLIRYRRGTSSGPKVSGHPLHSVSGLKSIAPGEREPDRSQPAQQPSPLTISSPSNGTDGLSALWSASTALLREPAETGLRSSNLPYEAINPPSVVVPNSQPIHSRASSPSDSDGPDGYFGDSSSFAFVSKVPPESRNENGVHLQNKRRERGLSLTHSAQTPGSPASRNFGDPESTYQLPDRHLADSLVDGYFDRVHPLYPFVHEPSFRAEYEKMWAWLPESTLRPSWYALLNLVFAHGCEFCDAVPEEQVLTRVAPFVARSRQIIFSHVFRKANLELVQSLLLMCHYLQGTLDLNECWNLVGLMIRTAFTIGLHLDPDSQSLTTMEKEVRKRVWWGGFIIDRTLSMKLGRPPSLQSTDANDVPLPVAVDDQYIHNDSMTPRQPARRPSVTAFFVHTVKLSRVIDSILRELYLANRRTSAKPSTDSATPESSRQSQVLGQAVLLDGQLLAWWKGVPAHLLSGRNAAEGRLFQRQRTVMEVRYLQIRILLQRQLLLIFSRQEIEDDFFRTIAIAGSQTCIYAARQTVRMIYSQYRAGLLNSIWYSLHYVFTSMGVLLHVQTMDKERLNMLGHDAEQETLRCGMEFLKTASHTSHLAARYVSMLERVGSKMGRDRSNGSTVREGNIGIAPSQANVVEVSQGPAETESPQFQSNDERQYSSGIDLDGMNFDDLLFGTGLPLDVLSFDYPNSVNPF